MTVFFSRNKIPGCYIYFIYFILIKHIQIKNSIPT